MSACAYGKHCISKMTKAKRLNDSTAHFLYAVVACIFDQRLQIVYHIILNHVDYTGNLFEGCGTLIMYKIQFGIMASE